jgi:hypothetical protein
MRIPLLITMMLLINVSAFGADELAEKIKQTDMNNADAVYELAVWCEANGKLSTSRKYYTRVLQIDKDHEATRTKFGQVKVNDRWIDAKVAGAAGPEKNKDGTASNPTGKRSGGVGPKASEVDWKLQAPAIEGENDFIQAQIMRMQTNQNDSNDMDSAVLTLYREDNRAAMVPFLCAALQRPDFTDLYGSSQLIKLFLKDGDTTTAGLLFGFIAKVSERNNEVEDLEMFCYAAQVIKDRRAIPRLIELMGHSEKGVAQAARKAFSEVSLVANGDDLSQAKALEWWNRNHNIEPKVWLLEQLKNTDPMTVLSAAEGLYQLRDKALFPAVFKVLSGDSRPANERGIRLITRATGNDWGYSPAVSTEDRVKIVAQMEKWWKANSGKFEWIEDRNKPVAAATKTVKVDPLVAMINDLASVEGNTAQKAEKNLLGSGNAAVPALLKGLTSESVIVRRKCNDILKDLAKKDVGYDPRAEASERDKSIAAWTAWAKSAGALGEAK